MSSATVTDEEVVKELLLQRTEDEQYNRSTTSDGAYGRVVVALGFRNSPRNRRFVQARWQRYEKQQAAIAECLPNDGCKKSNITENIKCKKSWTTEIPSSRDDYEFNVGANDSEENFDIVPDDGDVHSVTVRSKTLPEWASSDDFQGLYVSRESSNIDSAEKQDAYIRHHFLHDKKDLGKLSSRGNKAPS